MPARIYSSEVKVMRGSKALVLTVLIMYSVIGLFSVQNAGARLTVSSPQGMIEKSDLIIDGLITSHTVNQKQQQVSIEVYQVLKGTVDVDNINLSASSYLPGGKVPDIFPPKGNRVLVLVNGSGGDWHLAADLNAVAIISNSQVEQLYAGGSKISINDQSWEPQDYIEVYDRLYQANSLKLYDPQENENPRPWWLGLLVWIKGLWG